MSNTIYGEFSSWTDQLIIPAGMAAFTTSYDDMMQGIVYIDPADVSPASEPSMGPFLQAGLDLQVRAGLMAGGLTGDELARVVDPDGFSCAYFIYRLDDAAAAGAGAVRARGVRSGVRAGGKQVAGRATGVAPDAPEVAGGWGGSGV
jgi:hypothetical protein